MADWLKAFYAGELPHHSWSGDSEVLRIDKAARICTLVAAFWPMSLLCIVCSGHHKSGTMADFANTDSARRTESQVNLIIVLSVIPTVISTSSVFLRIYTRKFLLGGVASEDYAIIVAQLLGIGVALNNILMTTLGGLGRHLEVVMFTKGLFTAKVGAMDVSIGIIC